MSTQQPSAPTHCFRAARSLSALPTRPALRPALELVHHELRGFVGPCAGSLGSLEGLGSLLVGSVRTI